MPPVNRIFCIGKNYAAHISELAHLGFQNDGQCVIFMKPPSAIVAPGELHLPRNRGIIHHEGELVVRLGGLPPTPGVIGADSAARYVSHIALGIDLTLRTLQTELKQRGAPWEAAKAFDGAAPLGAWRPWQPDGNLQKLEFRLSVNGRERQRGNTENMLFPVARIIEILSRSWRLADGDAIYTGTPAGIGELQPGDVVTLAGAGCETGEWRCV
ncbi:MAG: FAA hydrolase family protein [Nevskiaceae bacterium]|nr:MAG: FAA hydrolase family protein [Nevskiaceae bacterium]TBR74305.1 MAG: FAA hydrolase family protein [Nevskiaceae bacterium]